MESSSPLPPISADEDVLREHLKHLDMSSICGNTESLTMDQILENMKKVKQQAAEEKRLRGPPEPYVPPGGWKQDPKMRLTISDPKPNFVQYKQDNSIARFHPSPPKWDRTIFPDKALYNALYRTPCRDPSGKLYLSVTREAFGGEMAGTWKYPGTCKERMPPATSVLCSKTFQKTLVEHATTTVERVEKLYADLPAYTESQRNIKAKVGADLNNLQMTRGKIVGALEADKLKKTQARSRSNSPVSRSGPASPASPDQFSRTGFSV
jgi:hypothetical protein